MTGVGDLRDLAFQVQNMAAKEAALEARVKELEVREDARIAARNVDERKFWVAGIMTLGSVVVTLVGVIWAYRTQIFGGTP